MRNQKGITLVALVVTIVVLLILAGVSIAMLSGDNGIITNARNAAAASTEGEVIDRLNLAYNTVKTEIIAKTAVDSSYDATKHMDEFEDMIKAELGDAEEYTVTPGTSEITVKYTDANFDGDPYNEISAKFAFEAEEVSYEMPARQVNVTSSDADGE